MFMGINVWIYIINMWILSKLIYDEIPIIISKGLPKYVCQVFCMIKMAFTVCERRIIYSEQERLLRK